MCNGDGPSLLDLLVDWTGFLANQAKQNLQGDDGLLESMLALTCKGAVTCKGCLRNCRPKCFVNELHDGSRPYGLIRF
jgi:hypothetical protein